MFLIFLQISLRILQEIIQSMLDTLYSYCYAHNYHRCATRYASLLFSHRAKRSSMRSPIQICSYHRRLERDGFFHCERFRRVARERLRARGFFEINEPRDSKLFAKRRIREPAVTLIIRVAR